MRQPLFDSISLSFPMINHLLDIGKEDFCDRAVRADELHGRFAERLRAAQVVNAPTDALPVIRDDFDILAVEHPL